MTTMETRQSALARRASSGFFSSHRWPLVTILVYTLFSTAAFTPRLITYLTEGHWGQSATRAFEFAPMALDTHALLGMALIPLFFLQPVLGGILMGDKRRAAVAATHRWQGRFLTLTAAVLSALGFYITYRFASNTDSVTSVIFMFLVALLTILFFAQAGWEARRRQIARHLDALAFAMIFLSLPASGRLIEAVMRGAFGIENTRSREPIPIGFGYQAELVDVTILVIAAVPLGLWAVYALPRGVHFKHPAKLAIATAFFVLPLSAVIAQTLGR